MTVQHPEPLASESATPPFDEPRTPVTSGLAVFAFVSSFFIALVGIICGHVALTKINRTGDSGRGLAIAALAIGYGTIVAAVALAIVVELVVNSTSQHLGETVDPSTVGRDIARSDCAVVNEAGAALVKDIPAAFQEASTSLEKSQADTWAASGTFKDATVNLTTTKVRAGVTDVDAKLDAMNAAFAALVAAPADQRDPAALQAAANDVGTAWRRLAGTCTTLTK